MNQKSMFFFLGLSLTAIGAMLLMPSAARAETVENISGEPVEISLYGETVVIPPQGLEWIPGPQASQPWFRELLRSKQLRVVREPEKQLKAKLTEGYCRSEDYPDDPAYCFLDLAEQDGSPMYCAMGLDSWGAVKECLYYVDRKRKLTADDCNVFDPKGMNRQRCIEYVNSGIPSKPGQSYEQSLKLS